MKRASSLIRRYLSLIIAISFLIPIETASAAPITETFGNVGSCAIQTSGLTVTYNGLSLTNTTSTGYAGLGSPYAGLYLMTGCHISFAMLNKDTIFTFPSTSRPLSFSFSSGAVDGTQQGTINYLDGSTGSFTITNASPVAGEQRTVTGNGKLIAGFTINWFAGDDFWFLDNLSWTAGAKTSTTTSISAAANIGSKGLVDTLTVTTSAAGQVTLLANNKRIAGCIAKSISTTVTCLWNPTVQGAVNISAVFTPTDTSVYESSSASKTILISKRSNAR
jgi:hypothetical protein